MGARTTAGRMAGAPVGESFLRAFQIGSGCGGASRFRRGAGKTAGRGGHGRAPPMGAPRLLRGAPVGGSILRTHSPRACARGDLESPQPDDFLTGGSVSG